MQKIKTGILLLIALATFANGVWMVLFPENWFYKIPAKVPDFGPFNEHFVRDFGACYFITGLLLLLSFCFNKIQPVAILFAAAFYTIHALTHVFDTGRGHVDAMHWLVDFPTSYLPAILLIWLASKHIKELGRQK